ncbi:MAG: hypothetical protein E7027_06720 [Elusimicrobium sp.]|uniref:Uncharacterized protein n=1 Tax=Candidatus Avelusimicrobium gallicola TaxID=2562704 RepID=A0A928HGI7_9BACT|nr:hypothetical protein [Elusimicrobium sp.]
MKNIWNTFWDFLDPYRKGPLFWKYGWKGILFIILGTWGMYEYLIGPKTFGLAGVLQLFTIGIHEAGHPLFRMAFLGNFKMTILGGTIMELGVPLLAFFIFLRRGKEIQADICLLLLAIACYSVGHYAGCSLDPVIVLLNATGPEAVPDWDYMHKWFGTEGYEWHIRHAFYGLSAFLTVLGVYLSATHFWAWNNPDKHNYNDDTDAHDRFFMN